TSSSPGLRSRWYRDAIPHRDSLSRCWAIDLLSSRRRSPIPLSFPGRIAFLFPNTPLIAALNLFVLANASFAVGCLVPTKRGTPPSDGTQLLFLLREPHVDRDIAHYNLHAWLLFGVRPRDWEPSLVAKLQEPGSAETEIRAPLYLYYYHEDRG